MLGEKTAPMLFVHHNSHEEFPKVEAGPRDDKPATNGLMYGAVSGQNKWEHRRKCRGKRMIKIYLRNNDSMNKPFHKTAQIHGRTNDQKNRRQKCFSVR